MTTPPSFGRLLRAAFVERPNRFIVHARLAGGNTVVAHMPNPGRLKELLMPEVPLLLQDHGDTERKTRYTAMAVMRDGAPVFLHTGINNRVAEYLLSTGQIPSLEHISVQRSEITVGNSRFDFLLREGRGDTLLEVKSVTLFGNRVAMFPDAITERGRRHIEELAELSSARRKHVVLFLVHTPKVDVFLPDYHTDLEFSRTLYRLRRRLRILPVAVEWKRNLRFGSVVKPLDIPWDYLKTRLVDSGAVLSVLRLGSDGNTRYAIGVSADTDDVTGVIRRLQRMKTLEPLGGTIVERSLFPIRTPVAISDSLVRTLRRRGLNRAEGWFEFESDPLNEKWFHRLVERFRMSYPD